MNEEVRPRNEIETYRFLEATAFMTAAVARFLSFAAVLALTACGGSQNNISPPAPSLPTNQSPVASAGMDQTFVERGRVRLRGQDSRDTDGSIAVYRWTQLSGPTVSLQEANTATPFFGAPVVDIATRLEFELQVTDDVGATNADTVAIDIIPDVIDDAAVIGLPFDNVRRAYTLYRPDGYALGNPVFLVLHGGGQSMRKVLAPDATTRRWVELADETSALLVVPNGFDNASGSGLGDAQSWNDLRDDTSGRTSMTDDVGFLGAVMNDVQTDIGYDRRKLFVSGSSNGGIMVMTLLIERPDDYAVGAAFIASLPEEAVPVPARPTPLFMLNGTEDPLIRIDGGVVGTADAPVRPVSDTVSFWLDATLADRDRPQMETLANRVADDQCILTRTTYNDADASSVFAYVEAVGGGHSIPDPQPPEYSPATLAQIGNPCRERHGIDLAFSFFTSASE